MTTRKILKEREFDWLLESSFIAALPEAEQDAVLEAMQWEDYASGEVIIQEGERPRGIDLIVTGRVAVAIRNRGGYYRTLTQMGPGNLIGERAVIRNTTTSARVTALSPMLTLYVSAARFKRLLNDNPTLRGYAENLVEVRDRSEELLRVMKTNNLLRSLGREPLDRLLQTSYLQTCAARGSKTKSLPLSNNCVYIVVRGSIKLYSVSNEGELSENPLGIHVQGSLLHHVPAILEKEPNSRLFLSEGSEALRIPVPAFRAITRQNPRMLRKLKEEITSLGWSVGNQLDLDTNIIAVYPSERRIGSTSLAYGIAKAIRRLTDGPTPVLMDMTGEESAQRLGWPVVNETIQGIAVRRMCVPENWDIKVIWPEQRDKTLALAHAMSQQEENQGLDVVISASAQARGDEAAIKGSDAVVMVHQSSSFSHEVPDQNGQFHVNAQRIGHGKQTHSPESKRHQVRIPHDLATSNAFWRDGNLSALIRETNPLGRACLRLGRVLLGQSVGLALGGGGAWGFAHIALVRSLVSAGIPIDYVAGSSFGSLVAGLYAAGGLDALDELVRRRSELLPVLLASSITTRPISYFVNDIIGPFSMEETEIPFFPITADLFTSEAVSFDNGSVADGVRASSSLPPIFPSLPSGDSRLVDGGIINIVPASVVWDAGADFVLASNVIPRTTLSLGSDNKYIKRLPDWTRPIQRLSDFVQSVYLMMWRSGVDRGREADYTVDLGQAEHRIHEFQLGDQIIEKAGTDIKTHMPHILRSYQSVCAFDSGSQNHLG